MPTMRSSNGRAFRKSTFPCAKTQCAWKPPKVQAQVLLRCARLNGGFEPNQGEPLNQINLKSFIKLIWGNGHVTDLKTVTRVTLDKEKA